MKGPSLESPPGEPIVYPRRRWACPLHSHWLLWRWTTWVFPLIILIFHVWLVVIDPYFIYHQESFDETTWICLENTKLFQHCVVLTPFTLKGLTQLQGWRIRGFEGAPAPPRRQKHPLEFKEKLHKTLYNAKIQQIYDVGSSNQGKSMVRTAKIRRWAMNWTVTSRKAPPGVLTILHPCPA